MDTSQMAIETVLQGEFDQVVEKTREALANHGFGILTTIDTQATLKAKLGVDSPPRVILGACNPPLAHKALEADPSVSLLMPCNVVVMKTDNGIKVSAMNPALMGEMLDNEEIKTVAADAVSKLQAAITQLEQG